MKNLLAAAGEEALTSDIVAQAHIEEVGLKLFEFADQQDRNAKFHKCVSTSLLKLFTLCNLCVLQEHDQGFFHIELRFFHPEIFWRIVRRGMLGCMPPIFIVFSID